MQLRYFLQKKDEFLSVTAHELKTPLTSIRGFSELMQKPSIKKDKKKSETYLQIIIEDTRRLEKLVTDILDLSRVDLGTLKLDMGEVVVTELISELRQLEDLHVTSHKLKPIYKIEKNLPKIHTDQSRLLQVLSNLINNSVKFTEKGNITTEVFKKGPNVHFRVTDTGIGIPKSEHKKIFDRFYQVDSTYTRRVGGSGLGLAISKALVESMGGRLWLESKVGKGTTFEFTVKISKPGKNEKDLNIKK